MRRVPYCRCWFNKHKQSLISQSLLSEDDDDSMNKSFLRCNKSRLGAGCSSLPHTTLTFDSTEEGFTSLGAGSASVSTTALFEISSRCLRNNDFTSAPLISDRKLVGLGAGGGVGGCDDGVLATRPYS